MLIGSPSYIAPERARGGQSGAPAGDLWGLGASLYAAVEGHPPFEREHALATLTAVVTDDPEPAMHAGPLWPVINGLLRKNPDERLGAAETDQLLRRIAAFAPADAAAAKAAPTEAMVAAPEEPAQPTPNSPNSPNSRWWPSPSPPPQSPGSPSPGSPSPPPWSPRPLSPRRLSPR